MQGNNHLVFELAKLAGEWLCLLGLRRGRYEDLTSSKNTSCYAGTKGWPWAGRSFRGTKTAAPFELPALNF